MPSPPDAATTLEAVVIGLVFVLPGALYEWAYERVVGSWNVEVSDRVLRFLGSSALLHALAFPATRWLWHTYLDDNAVLDTSGIPWGLWTALVLAVILPTVLGRTVGAATKTGRRWVVPLVGDSPAPRAWDHLFFRGGSGWVRLKLQSGTLLAGKFANEGVGARTAYAAGFPNPTDLYLIDQAELDADGRFAVDEDGNVVLVGFGVLVRYDAVEFLEFFPFDDNSTTEARHGKKRGQLRSRNRRKPRG